MSEITKLEEIAKMILSEAKSQGSEHASVNITETKNIGTRYGEKHITQNVYRNTQSFMLQTQIGQKIGRYNGSRPTADNIKQMVTDAIELTKFSAPDPQFPGFIEDQPTYLQSSQKTREMEPEEISQLVKQVVETGTNFDSSISAVAGNLHYIRSSNIILNSNDVIASRSRSVISGVINIAATEKEGEARSTSRVAGVSVDDLNLDSMARSVAQKARDGLNQGEMDVGKYEAILNQNAVAGLWRFIMMGASAEGLITHMSFLKDKVGEQLFDKRITVTDDTADPSHYSFRNYDSEMEPTHPITYFEDGIFKEYAHNRRTGKLLGVESNGRNAAGFQGEMPLFMSGAMKLGTKSEEELIASVDDGIYITTLFYNNFVNPPEGTCTGLTRDGLFRIKNGEIVGSLKNFRWMDSLFSIFKDAEPGNNIQQTGGLFGGGLKIPSLRVGEFNLSSKGKH